MYSRTDVVCRKMRMNNSNVPIIFHRNGIIIYFIFYTFIERAVSSVVQ